MEKCIKVMLVGYKDINPRKKYVFQDINKPVNHELQYITCVQSPNWDLEHVDIFQEGYLSYKHVKGGKDTYYDAKLGKDIQYQYDGIYLIDFVPVTHVLNNGFVTEAQQLTIS